MISSNLPILLQLRLLVGFLGERAQCGWWPTAFYEASSRLFLEPVFSKTSRLAQYHGVVEAARRLHDEHLSVGTYHLFRLPEEVEQDLHALVGSGGGDGLSIEMVKSKDAALEAMKQLAGPGASTGEGPIAVGVIGLLESTETFQAIASCYLSAFLREVKAYPYLVT